MRTGSCLAPVDDSFCLTRLLTGMSIKIIRCRGKVPGVEENSIHPYHNEGICVYGLGGKYVMIMILHIIRESYFESLMHLNRKLYSFHRY